MANFYKINQKLNPKLVTAIIGFCVGIIAYWFVPYNHYVVMGINIYTLMCLGCFMASLLLKILLPVKPAPIALLISLGFILAIIVRIFYDITFWDKTSHNLFPFELILYTLIIMPSAFSGSYLGYLMIPRKRN